MDLVTSAQRPRSVTAAALACVFGLAALMLGVAPSRAATHDDLSIEPGHLASADWGWMEVGDHPQIFEFKLTNLSDAAVTGIVPVGDGPFQPVGDAYCDGHQLAGNSYCEVRFGFTPAELGTVHGTIGITTDQGRTVSLPVSGSGYPEGGHEPTPEPDTGDPVVDSYFIEGIDRIDGSGERFYAWPSYDGHDAGGQPFDNEGLGLWEEQSRPIGGTWQQRLDANGVQYYPTGPAEARVRVWDTAGNVSDWKVISLGVGLADTSKTSTSTTRVQSWTGSWTKQTLSGPYKRTVVGNTTSGAKARFTATARRFALVARRTSDGGRIAIYVNGKKDREIDLTAPAGKTQDRRIVWQRRFGSTANRTIEVRTLTRPANHRKVLLDAWIIER